MLKSEVRKVWCTRLYEVHQTVRSASCHDHLLGVHGPDRREKQKALQESQESSLTKVVCSALRSRERLAKSEEADDVGGGKTQACGNI